MSKRTLNISDQMLLDNILDCIEPHKQSEATAYLQSIYGIENLEEYQEVYKDEQLELFTEKEIVEYYGEDLLSEYDDETLYDYIDRQRLHKTVNLFEVVSYRAPMDVLDCLLDIQIVNYLKLKGYDIK